MTPQLFCMALLATGAGLASTAQASVNVFKVCNYRAEEIWAAYSTSIGLPQDVYPSQWNPIRSHGWYHFNPSECKDLLFNFTGVVTTYAMSASGWDSDNAFQSMQNSVWDGRICVQEGAVFMDLDERVCAGAPANSPYKFKKTQSFDFSVRPRIGETRYNVYEVGYRN